MPSRPDELMLAVCGLRDTTPTLVVVDVEGTHRSGTLRVVSTTRCLTGIRGYLSLDSAFPMRRKDGTRSFFIEVELHYFEVEESTGVARLLSGGSYWPLNDSEYFLDGRVRLGDVPIWDCNNRGTTTPLKVIKIPTVPPERSNTRRGGGGDKRRLMLQGSRGFLFHTNTAESCITVIDPNLRNHTAMTPQHVTVLVEQQLAGC
ncbi:hypothetical protein Pelo_17882 [Pelomyxa schiedti]|nr:hypothetical protein Pelo_17882 [Pelomyxa schiedti]